MVHLGHILADLGKRKVGLRLLDLELDTSTATWRLMLNVLGSVAELERAMMLGRQREGIAKTKQEGRYKARAPTTMRETETIKRFAAEWVCSPFSGLLGKTDGATTDSLSAEQGPQQRSGHDRTTDCASGSERLC